MQLQRDAWIIGHGQVTQRPYVIHTQKPRFIAQVFDEGDPAGVRAPLSYALRDGRSLARFAFYDDFPDERTLQTILRWADEILARSPLA